MSYRPAKVRELRVARVQRSGVRKSRRLTRALRGALLAPAYWLLALFAGAPGLSIQLMAASLGVRLLLGPGGRGQSKRAFRLIFAPLDSVRYFELQTIWKWLPSNHGYRYLDISSPRLFPILLVDKGRSPRAVMVNPDMRDLAETNQFSALKTLSGRCLLTACLSEKPPFLPESFDVITSLSVIEHIPEDTTAVRALWGLLRPGGRLLLTVPCGPEELEEYIDQDVYGLLGPSAHGMWFWQRFYGPESLAHRIFTVTGSPLRMAVYGERTRGCLAENALEKWTDEDYPYWREPYLMATRFRYYDSLADMPGQGVVAMEFRKDSA